MNGTTHRWSGWPGAWCLDCGREDPMEEALANNHYAVDAEGWPAGGIAPEFEHLYDLSPCPEPGSKKHDPYARAQEEKAKTP